MASIYRCSSDLLVWLGELAPGHLGERQFNTLRESCSHIRTRRVAIKYPNMQHSTSRFLPGRMGKPTDFKDHYTSRGITTSQVLNSILATPWFHRRWVIQECDSALSERTYFLMGEAIIHREDLSSLLLSKDIMDRALPLNPITQWRDAFYLCYHYEATECSDPRDLVYAILHLCSDGHKVEVDYNQDVRDTYLNFVKRLAFGITAEMDLELSLYRAETQRPSVGVPDKQIIRMLALASCRKDQPFQSRMEKWVPDWRITPTYESLSHQLAVQTCVSVRTPDKSGQISCVIKVAPSGYHFLSVKGMLLNSLRGLTSHEAASYDIPSTIQKLMANLFDGLRSTCRIDFGPTDRIWLAWEGPDSNSLDDRDHLVIAFALRNGELHTVFDRRPVYYLYACFSFYLTRSGGYEYTYDYTMWSILSGENYGLPLMPILSIYGISTDQEFYLE